MKTSSYLPSAIAAAVLASLALPTAAIAATPESQPAAPAIESMWTVNDASNVHDGVGYVQSADQMSFGNVDAGAYRGERVVIHDEAGAQVCDTDDNAFDSADGLWECTATPATLSIGEHRLVATAYATDGTASAQSVPVIVHVVDPGNPGGGGETVDPGNPGGGGETVDPGNPGDATVPTPTATVTTAVGLSTIAISTETWFGFEVHDAQGRWVAGGAADGDGKASANVPTPTDTDAVYTVVAMSFEGKFSSPLRVTVPAAGEDSSVTPAPGPVDPDFTVGSGVSDLSVEWAKVKSSGGAMSISARLKGISGARLIATDSRGVTHESQIGSDGHVEVRFTLPLGMSPVFSAVQRLDGKVSKPVEVRPSR